MISNNLEVCVIDINNMSVYSFSNSIEGAEIKLKKAIEQNEEDIRIWEGHIQKYPDAENFKNYLIEARNKKYKVMTYEKYEELERDHYLNKPLTEITKENFEEMLNILPPVRWCTKNNIEMFCMSEMLTGSYTSQYLHDRNNNKFYHKIVNILDEKTWGYNFI